MDLRRLLNATEALAVDRVARDAPGAPSAPPVESDAMQAQAQLAAMRAFALPVAG